MYNIVKKSKTTFSLWLDKHKSEEGRQAGAPGRQGRVHRPDRAVLRPG